MLNKLSSIFFVVLLASFIYIVFFYELSFNFNQQKQDQPDFVFENIVVSHFNDEKLESEFKSDKAQIYRRDNKIYLYETQGAFFLDSINKIRFNSSNLIYDLDTSSIHLKNPYLVYFGDHSPVWLSSSELNYSVNDQIIRSASLTNFYFMDGFVESNNLMFNLTERKVFLDDNPIFNLNLPDG